MKYKTVSEKNTDLLDREVSRLLNKGYQLRGDVIVNSHHYNLNEYTRFTQVLTRS
jgi:hypothetical protein